MKRLIALCMALSLACVFTVGCEKKKSETKVETTKSNPEGSTTVTESTTVEQKGDNPPPTDAAPK